MRSSTDSQPVHQPGSQAKGAAEIEKCSTRNRDSRVRYGAVVLAMAIWIFLNVFDLLITYEGLALGLAYEANRFMAAFVRFPVLAVSVKLTLAVLVLHAVQRIETRTPYSGLLPLIAVNLYVAWACLHNLDVIAGQSVPSYFLRWYPLAGSPP
jgi:hypothetical protein